MGPTVRRSRFIYPRLARALDAQDMPTIDAIRIEAGDKFDTLIKQAIGPTGCSGCRKRREWWTAQGFEIT